MADHRRGSLAACTVAVALLLSCPAAAIDGEIVVDQTAVDAGGISPGDAPGYPVTISRRGKYKLTGDLAVPAGVSGFEVSARDVTLDPSGFAIRSVPALQANTGVHAESSSVENLTVMNGTVVEFRFGGISVGGPFAVVENVRAISNSFGIQAATDARILNSTVAFNTDFGLSCAFRCLVEQNVVTGTKSTNSLSGKGRGVLIGSGLVLGNVIVSNAGEGIVGDGIGFGNNLLFGNNSGGTQVLGGVFPLHPNLCSPFTVGC